MSGNLQTTIRDLGRRRGRARRGLALAEGVRLVEEAVAAGIELWGAAVSPALEATARGRALKSGLVGRGVRLEEVSEAELDRLADTDHPQGIVAVIRPRPWSLDQIPTPPGAVVLVLDTVQDPGNVGTMLRTALGLGAAGVVALKGTAEVTGPKALRGSMGALFRLPTVPADPPALLAWAGAREVELWVAETGGEPIARPAVPRGRRAPVALVVGNEGAGVDAEIGAAAARRVGIPLAPGTESLNVAAAAAILLYEITRDG